MNEETTYIAVPIQKHWIEFEESPSMEVSNVFPLTSRLVKKFGIIRCHWAIKIAYYLGIFPIVAVICGVIDVIIIIAVNIPSALKFCFINLFAAIRWVVVEIWGLVGELLKSFFKKFLAVMGVFLAGYVIYLFIKTGSWINIWELIKQMFGGIF